MQRKKLNWLIFSLIAGTAFAIAAGVLAAGTPLRVICDTWPPYQITNGGHVTGYSSEMVRAVFKRMDQQTEPIKSYPWKRALSLLESGHADALFSANNTKDRIAFAIYPDEVLFDSPWVIWTRRRADIQTLDDLKGKSVGVVIGYSYTRDFWDFIETHCRIEKVTTDEINFKKLSMGRLDAIVAEYGNGVHLTRELGIQSVTPHPEITIKKDGLYIMFNKDTVSKEFVEAFSKELKAFKRTDEYKQLREKYFGADESVSSALAP